MRDQLGRSRAAQITVRVLIFVLVIAVWVFYLFPIFWLLTSSLKTRVDLFSMPPKWVFTPTLQYYLEGFGKASFTNAVRNSLLVTALTVICSLGLGSLAAYALARFKFRGATTVGFSLIIARMIPPIVFVVPLFLLLDRLRLRNTYWGLVLIFTTFNLPFTVWMLRSFFEDVPIELEEAAWIDGASRIHAFLRIIIPLTAPGLAATAVFAALLAWNEFLFALLMGGPATATLPVYMSGFMGEHGVDWGEIMATATLAILPPVIFAMLVQRNLIKGLTLGAVKG